MPKRFAGFLLVLVLAASAASYAAFKQGWLGSAKTASVPVAALATVAEAEAAGRAQATKDLAAGKLEYHDYGLSSDHQKFMGEILQAKYAVKLTSVGDCCLTEQEIAEAKAYNVTVNEELKKKFKLDVFADAEKEAAAKVAAAGGPAAPAALIPPAAQSVETSGAPTKS